MAKTKKTVEKVEKLEVVQEVVAPAEKIVNCTVECILVSDLIKEVKSKISSIASGHREIDLAKDDAQVAINRALALVLFIESTQVEIAKKKR